MSVRLLGLLSLILFYNLSIKIYQMFVVAAQISGEVYVILVTFVLPTTTTCIRSFFQSAFKHLLWPLEVFSEQPAYMTCFEIFLGSF